MTIDPMSFPLLNTVLLLSSGIYITIGHQAIKLGDYRLTAQSMNYTIIMGILFSVVQYYEYTIAPFCINDSVYGSIFYMLTGFHGVHVLVGVTFLIVCAIRHYYQQLYRKHHVGFVCAI
jgi:heme/copper-type cytochrome/quinol oxidase subunit 3